MKKTALTCDERRRTDRKAGEILRDGVSGADDAGDAGQRSRKAVYPMIFNCIFSTGTAQGST
jgi:hypothetical protein